MTKEKILKLIGASESINVEWKPSLSQSNEIIETISAFSNTEGGKIFVGVSKSGKLLGIEIGKDTIERLTNKISQNTDPKIHPRIITQKIDKKCIIIVEAQESSDHLVLAFGRPFKRVGRSTVRMSKDEYERLILEKHKDKLYFDAQICEGATLEDINEEKIKWFLKEARHERNLNIPVNTPINEVLMRLNALKNGKLTNASILLFGKDPQKFFFQAEVKCIRFKGNEPVKPFIDMKVISENIIDQVNKSLNFVLEHIPKAVWLDGKPQREERYKYPPDAIREAIVNAICHRNYEEKSNVQIRVFDDYLEVWSPGELPSPLTPKDLRKTHKSIPRNPLMARQFFWIRFIEEVGTGTNDMIRYCKEWEIPEPKFKHITGDFVVTFSGKITEEYLRSLGLNERQIKVIKYINEKGKITNGEFREMFPEISGETARLDLNDLVKKRVLDKKGEKRGAYYVIK